MLSTVRHFHNRRVLAIFSDKLAEDPMLFEASIEWESDAFAVEVNHFVDIILSTIISHPSSRRHPILLLSFSPEVCILLSIKHNKFPILFLSKSGTLPYGDTRASSTREAVHFATSWGLDEIVTRSDPSIFALILIQYAKKKGLITASFGKLNGDPHYAEVYFHRTSIKDYEDGVLALKRNMLIEC